MSIRKIIYVSGTRADFGLMKKTLCALNKNTQLSISLCVTGMHLSDKYGATVTEIEESGLSICARIPVDIETTTKESMAKSTADQLKSMVDVFEHEHPDLVLLLGDRSEVLAGAIAALHLNIPIVHIHGGECSGTIDESIRHAISKLAHYHFVSTKQSYRRLVRMGEAAKNIFITGAPGLEDLKNIDLTPRAELYAKIEIDGDNPIVLVIFHAVVQQSNEAAEQMDNILRGVLSKNEVQAVCFAPNSDAGGEKIRQVIDQYSGHKNLKYITHLDRHDFLSLLSISCVMVGNSSSGIFESASFGLRVINIGDRQYYRERSGNVVDVPPVADEISRALTTIMALKKFKGKNVYHCEKTSEIISHLLETLPLDKIILNKSNTY